MAEDLLAADEDGPVVLLPAHTLAGHDEAALEPRARRQAGTSVPSTIPATTSSRVVPPYFAFDVSTSR